MYLEPYRRHPIAVWTRRPSALALSATALGALALGAAAAGALLGRRAGKRSLSVAAPAPDGYHLSVLIVETWVSGTGGG